jgi:uncharacterized protein with PhoU and TrkA domain
MHVLAMKRGSKWIYSPDKNKRLQDDDLIIASGPTEGIPAFCKLATGKEYKEREKESEVGIKRKWLTEEIADLIADMKNISELMVGLSYSAVTFYSKEIAREVRDLEESMDRMKEELEILVINAARGITKRSSFEELRGLLHIAWSSEILSDAAYEIADVVLRDIPLHPVFLASIEESDEIILKMEVKNADIFDRTLKELKVETRTGMFILAIRRRDGKWVYNPAGNTEIRNGDLLIMRGPREGETKMREICGAQSS